ncbi:MAG: hypothetical protein EXR93_11850 [Gemmatimonadetes bacterium]|nr:hypothetical protein [Gemmatimonadota bacterium]
MRRLVAFSICAVTLASPLTAQQQARAVRLEGATPAIDGRLDDSAWRAALPITEFVQKNPTEGQPASERTEVRFLFTDSDLYVGIRAFDREPDGIVGPLVRRDPGDIPTDYVAVKIDSYHDRRTAFEFTVNPAGSRSDEFIYDDGARSDNSWDPVYDWAATRDGEGWSAELRIPFSQLRFPRADALTFGLRVVRVINRRNEEANWPFVPRDQAGEVSHYGELVGLNNVPSPRRLEALPYTSGSRQIEPAVGGSALGSRSLVRAGGELKVGLTSGLTLDATFNPDFGQVEADAAVVNLTGFESFFPEKRPFFVEGTDLLRFTFSSGFGGDEGLMYTRRIGRSPQLSPSVSGSVVEIPTATSILGAAKVSGQLGGGWSLGAAQALTSKELAPVTTPAGVQTGSLGVEPLTSYSVVRVQRTMQAGRLTYGAIATGAVRSLDDAAFDVLHRSAFGGGLDVRGRFHKDRYEYEAKVMGTRVSGSTGAILRTQLATSHVFQRPDQTYFTVDSARTSLMGFAGNLRVARVTGFTTWLLRYTTRSPGIEPNDIGFLRRSDQHQVESQLSFRWLRPGRVFRRFEWRLQQDLQSTYGWEMGSTTSQTRIDATFRNYWTFNQNAEWEPRHVDTRVLRGGPAIDVPAHFHFNGGLSSDPRRRLTWTLSWQNTVEDESGRRELTVNTGLNFRPPGPVSVSLSARRQWGMDDRQYLATRILGTSTHYVMGRVRRREVNVTFRSDIALTPRLSVQVYGQPFASARRFDRFRLVANPRVGEYTPQFDFLGPDRLTRPGDGSALSVDLARDGTPDFTVSEPDRRLVSLRTNLVIRWEFRPGSSLFLVWNQNRADDVYGSNLRMLHDLGDSFTATGRHVLALKVSYWIGL